MVGDLSVDEPGEDRSKAASDQPLGAPPGPQPDAGAPAPGMPPAPRLEILCQREFLDSLFVFVAVLSVEGVLLEANQAMFDLGRVQPRDALGKVFFDLDPLAGDPELSNKVRGLFCNAANGNTVRSEVSVRQHDGRVVVIDSLFAPLRDASGTVTHIIAVGVDVSDRKLAEAALSAVNRELRLLRSCDQLLIRATDEGQLLNEICRIVVEIGGYRLAWVGFAQHDAGCSVLPVAHAGVILEYARGLGISWAKCERGNGPTGRAIRERRISICRDMQNDPDFAPWREDARKAHYVASIALPLFVGGECVGAFNIYSDNPAAFRESEVALLADLAADMGYGVEALRTQIERAFAEGQARRLARIGKMQSGINAAVLRIRDADELLKEACRIATEVGGYDRAVISLVEDNGRCARPRYRAGTGADFPEPAILEISDGSEADTNLSSRALRTGEIAVCSDLNLSEPPVAMRERLLQLGYKSVVALPLIVEGTRVGVLTLTSRDINLIRDEELLLLADMMASLSFGLRSQQHADTAQFLAFYDPLTGLAKRALFCERLEPLLQGPFARAKSPAIAVFDIRGLSHLNDTFGRHFGDLVLQQVAERLKTHSRGQELTGYLGAGTFVMAEPQLAPEEGAVAALLEEGIFGEPFSVEGRTIRLSYRSGAARYPVDGADSNTLVQKAEAALKQARESGEQYLHYQLEMHSGVAERLALEHKLRTAIDEKQFEVYYQPQLSVATGRIDSVEALLRWNDPDSGIVAPASFLPVLESSGMIPTVGNWVLQQVVHDCERWCRLGLGPVRVAVNVSALQLARRSFPEDVLGMCRRLVASSGFGFDLEITETAVMRDVDGASRTFRQLRAAGIRIALDDFGTGYSSLGLLSKLPVDVVKIDRSFIAGLPADPVSATLVESIVGLASALRLSTVAEGVETEEQLGALRRMNCSYWQGYLFSAAVPAQELDRLLRNNVAGPRRSDHQRSD